MDPGRIHSDNFTVMKRFRISTLMLLIVIAALCTALIVQQRRAARREIGLEFERAQLQARLAESFLRVKALDDERARMLKIVQEITKKMIDLEVAAKCSEANSRSEVKGEGAARRASKRGESTQTTDCQ
jgi:hypothetical protein